MQAMTGAVEQVVLGLNKSSHLNKPVCIAVDGNRLPSKLKDDTLNGVKIKAEAVGLVWSRWRQCQIEPMRERRQEDPCLS